MSTILALTDQGLTYKGLMKFHPSSFRVSTVLKSKSSRTLNVIGRKSLVLSHHTLTLSSKASSSASGTYWVSKDIAHAGMRYMNVLIAKLGTIQVRWLRVYNSPESGVRVLQIWTPQCRQKVLRVMFVLNER